MDNRFLTLQEVLVLHRQHPPTAELPFSTEPESPDHCLVVRQRHLQPYRLEGAAQWVDYARIRACFEEMQARGARARTRPYQREEVFAPFKLLLAERDRPIRALIAEGPVYPWRGKLAVLRPGQPRWLGHAAVAVLNSRLGQAYYHSLLLRFRGRDSSPSGLDEGVLHSLPVARRDYGADELHAVASLVHQLGALHRARQACLPLLQRSGEAPDRPADLDQESRLLFDLQLRTVQARLQEEVRRLLGLTRAEEKALLTRLRLPELRPPSQPRLFDLWDEAQPLPPPPPVRIVPAPYRGREVGAVEAPEWLAALRRWELAANTPPARE